MALIVSSSVNKQLRETHVCVDRYSGKRTRERRRSKKGRKEGRKERRKEKSIRRRSGEATMPFIRIIPEDLLASGLPLSAATCSCLGGGEGGEEAEATLVNSRPAAKREISARANERNIKGAVTRNKTKAAGMWTLNPPEEGWVWRRTGGGEGVAGKGRKLENATRCRGKRGSFPTDPTSVIRKRFPADGRFLDFPLPAFRFACYKIVKFVRGCLLLFTPRYQQATTFRGCVPLSGPVNIMWGTQYR